MLRKLIVAALFAFAAGAVPVAALAVSPPCDNTIYGMDSSGRIYSFKPPAAAATYVGFSVLYGTIARGVYTGNLYDVAGSTLYSYDLGTGARTTVGQFTGASSFLIASGFSQTGLGYTLSTSETWLFPDASTSSPTKLGAPQTDSGPGLGNFNGGDLAVDVTGTGWIILSNASNYSYLYTVQFGPAITSLHNVTQIFTSPGVPYTTADLYSLAFAADGTLYASSAGTGHLYSVDQTTGILTDLGAQGAALLDFASCPFGATAFLKTAPLQTANGELVGYVMTATNSSTTASASYTISDQLASNLTYTGYACSPTTACTGVTPNPPATAANVNASITVAPATSSTTPTSTKFTIFAKNGYSTAGTVIKNTAIFTKPDGVTKYYVSASSTQVANDVIKTITNSSGQTVTTAKPGDTLTYTITYTNLTNVALAAYSLLDTVPQNVTFVKGSATCVTVPAGLTCTPPSATTQFNPGDTLSWTLGGGTFANGQKMVVQFKATVN